MIRKRQKQVCVCSSSLWSIIIRSYGYSSMVLQHNSHVSRGSPIPASIHRALQVRPSEKQWKCEPCLYLPPKSEWVDLDKHPEARHLLWTVRHGTPQQVHDAVIGCGKLDISRIRDHRGRCVLHYASQKGNVSALEYFGPLANALDSEGWAPLHYAAYWGNRISCDRLVQLGADIDMLCSAHGRTAFDYAVDGQMKCTMGRRRLDENYHFLLTRVGFIHSKCSQTSPSIT